MNLNSSPLIVKDMSVFSLVNTEWMRVSSRSNMRNFFLASRLEEGVYFWVRVA